MPIVQPIPERPEDAAAYAFLIDLARAFQAETEGRGHQTVLKGGTSLKFAYGLPRPSTDLDFEGDASDYSVLPITRAARKRLPPRWKEVKVHRPAWRWLLRSGTIRISAVDSKTGAKIDTRIDFRRLGSMPGIPKTLDPATIRRIEGINVFEPRTAMQRKLAAFIGPNRRTAVRDAFDAAWIRETFPQYMTDEQKREMDTWPERAREGTKLRVDLDRSMANDPIMQQTTIDQIRTDFVTLKNMEAGREKLPGSRAQPPTEDIRDAVRQQAEATKSKAAAAKQHQNTIHSRTTVTKKGGIGE